MQATIVIATLNEEKYIEECIESLERQSINQNQYQILIIDGNSKDNTNVIVKRLENKYKNIKLLKNEKIIQSAAFNIGIKECNTDYIFIVGAHAIYDYEFIEKSLKAIKQENTTCVGGKVTFSAKSDVGKTFARIRGTLIGGGVAKYRYSNKRQLVTGVSFGCYKSEILKKIGGYNEKLVKNQDNDMNTRIANQGGTFLFDPEIKFTYFTRETIEEIKKQMHNYGYWEAKVIKADRHQFKISTIIPSIFVISLILSILMIPVNMIILSGIISAYFIAIMIFYMKDLKDLSFFKVAYIIFIIHSKIGIGFIKGIFR